MLVDCLFGRIVIGRESILVRKLNEQPEKETLKFKSKERDSITLNERTAFSEGKLMWQTYNPCSATSRLTRLSTGCSRQRTTGT